MKQLILIFGWAFLLVSCDFVENKEKEAIEVCKNAKAQIKTENDDDYQAMSNMGLATNSTWLDVSNLLVQDDPNTDYQWSAQKTEERDIYLVGFLSQYGIGLRWEVTLKENLVRFINSNEYLLSKYERQIMESTTGQFLEESEEDQTYSDFPQATDLYAKYKSNMVAFDKEHDKKPIEFEGKIVEIKNSHGCAKVIIQGENDGFGRIDCGNCSPNGDHWSDEVVPLLVGDVVRIKGYYSASLSSDYTIWFSKCHVIQ